LLSSLNAIHAEASAETNNQTSTTDGKINGTSQQLAEFIATIENVQQELTGIKATLLEQRMHPINCVPLSRKLSLTRPFSRRSKNLM